MFIIRVDWNERHLTPVGNRGKVETPQAYCAEEAQLPPRGKQVPAVKRNGLYSNIVPIYPLISSFRAKNSLNSINQTN